MTNLGAVAALYLMLGAEFLAAAQVIVYAGAIMVLFVFAIMVLIPGKEETGPDPRRVLAAAGAAGRGRSSSCWWSWRSPGAGPAPGRAAGGRAAWRRSGALLFTDYLFPFELTSVLLLAAMVGVLLLARAAGPETGDVPETYYVALVRGALFASACSASLIRRNPLVIFMSIELMLNAANLSLRGLRPAATAAADGQALVFFVMAVAAAEVAVGLAIIVAIFRLRRRLSVDELSLMRW